MYRITFPCSTPFYIISSTTTTTKITEKDWNAVWLSQSQFIVPFSAINIVCTIPSFIISVSITLKTISKRHYKSFCFTQFCNNITEQTTCSFYSTISSHWFPLISLHSIQYTKSTLFSINLLLASNEWWYERVVNSYQINVWT